MVAFVSGVVAAAVAAASAERLKKGGKGGMEWYFLLFAFVSFVAVPVQTPF